MTRTIDPSDFRESKFADSAKSAYQLGPQRGDLLPLARVGTIGEKSRAWRITLNRVDRNDLSAFQADKATPLWVAQDVAFTASVVGDPAENTAVPPRRGNPIFGRETPGNGADVEPIWVQINWGMAGGKTNRMLGNWPMLGGSVVVEGSWVEVYGGVAVFGFGAPAIQPGEFPFLAAQVVPTDGLASADNGELSIQQQINIESSAGATFLYSLDGVTNPAQGLTTANFSPPQATLISSAVFGVAPFGPYDPVIAQDNPFSRPTLVVDVRGGVGFPVNAFELRDNQIPTGNIVLGAPEWVSAPGSVGVVYWVAAAGGVTKTGGQMDALLNTSTLIHVVTPCAAPAEIMYTDYATAIGFAPVNGGFGDNSSALLLAGGTQGGSLYIPDFARRVRVQMVELQAGFAGNEYRVPLTGPPRAQLNFYDDLGRVVDAVMQGILTNTNIDVKWHPIPARATMMKVYGEAVVGTINTALVHWRIAP